jgi:hypothetical protein
MNSLPRRFISTDKFDVEIVLKSARIPDNLRRFRRAFFAIQTGPMGYSIVTSGVSQNSK